MQGTIEAAFKEKKYHIEAQPSNLMVDEMVDLTLVFANPALADSPLISNFDIQWDFEGGGPGPHGVRCIHFFRSTLFKGKERRVLSMPVTIKVTVNVVDAPAIETTLILHRERYMDTVIARGEVLSTWPPHSAR